MSRRTLIIGGIVLLLALGGGAWWWLTRPEVGPAAFATGNGRVEADLIDVASQIAGRIAEISADEGDLVAAGDVLARIDTDTLEAQLARAEADVARAESEIQQARAMIDQRDAARDLAQTEYDRAETLRTRNVGTEEAVDRARSELSSAAAGADAARASLTAAQRAADAARAQAREIQSRIDDATLTAPVQGRVLYRLAQPGEVIAAGGRVVTLVDLSRVYMEVFLPTEQTARLALGAEARIRLDGLGLVLPATVSFVSPEAQFTPEHVETQDVRADLMFRVRLRVPQQLIEDNIAYVKTGMRGTATVRLAGSDAPWPADLAPTPPPVRAD
ncbi:HlyD family secretion protein [Jannaschia rubra]|uniref:Multidrug resistance protein MdtN n=1 Tax=Jannaschia rubra TaxID=282197 RepID=A0A0M6XV08_9RHOB|nr:HlyD family efflux transporter periplasmic adaptor subunit [Jannaschia rubra]CTQ34572.1 Multidrug resistance protein MdtN [Jannaschia rubra]SFG71294.1 HlyD family secretion protein [Jannaschia rubra]